MRSSIALLGLCATLGIGGGAALASPKVPFVSTMPVERFYPDIAQRMEAGGWVRLLCTPDSAAKLNDCTIDGVGPAEMGFGEAGRRLAPYLRVALKGKALDAVVGTRVEVMIRFVVPSEPAQVIAPPAGVLSAAKPAGGPDDGFVRMNCRVSLGGGGGLTDCESGFEAPKNAGLGAAARDLAVASYRSALRGAPRHVRVSLNLEEPSGLYGSGVLSNDNSLVLDWPAALDPAIMAQAKTASAITHRVVMSCDLDRAGSLLACAPEGAPPADALKAAQALIAAAKVFRDVYFTVIWSSQP